MSENLLTHELIAACFAGHDAGASNQRIVNICAIIMFALGMIFLWMDRNVGIFLTIFCWGLGVLFLYLKARNKKFIGAVLRKDYVLQEDVCVKKWTKSSTDSVDDTKCLMFANSGRHELGFGNVLLGTEISLKSMDIYETAEQGDTFYLLRVAGRSKGADFVFNSRIWSIDTREFTRVQDCHIPNR